MGDKKMLYTRTHYEHKLLSILSVLVGLHIVNIELINDILLNIDKLPMPNFMQNYKYILPPPA